MSSEERMNFPIHNENPEVWEYFVIDYENPSNAKCKFCLKFIHRSGIGIHCTTTELFQHLQYEHELELNKNLHSNQVMKSTTVAQTESKLSTSKDGIASTVECKYFVIEDGNPSFAKCTLCLKLIYRGGIGLNETATELSKHLQYHNIELNKNLELREAVKSAKKFQTLQTESKTSTSKDASELQNHAEKPILSDILELGFAVAKTLKFGPTSEEIDISDTRSEMPMFISELLDDDVGINNNETEFEETCDGLLSLMSDCFQCIAGDSSPPYEIPTPISEPLTIDVGPSDTEDGCEVICDDIVSQLCLCLQCLVGESDSPQ